MEKPLREDEIVTMHQLSELTLSLTNRISQLKKFEREINATYNRVGFTFEYGSDNSLETPTIDILVDVSTGSKPDPLKTAWYAFVKIAKEEIEKEIEEKYHLLNDVKQHYKKM